MIYSCLDSIAFLSIISAVTPEKNSVSIFYDTDFLDTKNEEISPTNIEEVCAESKTADTQINVLHTVQAPTPMVFHNPCNISTSRAQVKEMEPILIHVHLFSSVTEENPDAPENDNELEGKRCLFIDEMWPSPADKSWDAQPPLEASYSAKKRLFTHRHGCFKFLHRSYADCSGDLIE